MADVPVSIKLYIVKITGLILYNSSVFTLFCIVCLLLTTSGFIGAVLLFFGTSCWVSFLVSCYCTSWDAFR
jgi:hypothetical protein